MTGESSNDNERKAISKNLDSFIEEHGRDPVSDQELHDFVNANRKVKPTKASAKRLKTTLATSRPGSYSGSDPIAMAMANHPGLTEDEAMEIAEKFGF